MFKWVSLGVTVAMALGFLTIENPLRDVLIDLIVALTDLVKALSEGVVR